MDAVAVLEGELRQFRKTLDLSRCPQLIRVLGGGEPVLARNQLFEVARFFPEDTDVQVAFASMQGRGDVTARLNDASDLVGGIEARNVRTYSDRGIKKVAQYLVTGNGLAWPVLNLFFVQIEPQTVDVWYTLLAREGMGTLRQPTVSVNGKRLEQTMSRMDKVYEGYRGLRMSEQRFPAEGFSSVVAWKFGSPPALYINTMTLDEGAAWALRSGLFFMDAELRIRRGE